MFRRFDLTTRMGQARIHANGEMILRLSFSCLEVAQLLGEALTECERANLILNTRRNYEGRAKASSEDRVGSTTVALEARLRNLISFYFQCSGYLGNVWEHMSAADEALANRIMTEFAFNNQDWVNDITGGGG